jgi:transmembrane sensor
MSAPEGSRDHARREEAATEWICERAEGFAPGRAEAFAAWCAADPYNAAAVARVERTLHLLEELPAVRAPLQAKYGRGGLGAAGDGHVEASTVRRDGGVFFRPAWAVAMAAVLLVAALGVWTSARWRGAGERFATSSSGPQRVALQDGSVVDLNGASEVRVAYSDGQRRVTLGAGEAHFQVAHDPARPFVVTAGGVTVRAVGTAFNVRLTEGAVDVVVTEGKVEVRREADAAAEPARVVVGERVRLEPSVPTSTPAVEKVAPAAMRALLAWQERMTSFTDVPLRELVARFNRHNATQLVLPDAALGERKLGGIFALDQVEVFVRLLEQEGDIVAERRGDTEIVLRSAR